MILPGLFPAQVRTRPIVRNGVAFNNARVNTTTISFSSATIAARPGDLVFFTGRPEGSSPSVTGSNFGATLLSSTSPGDAFKFWDGTEPSTLSLTGSGINIATYVVYVVSGLARFVGNSFVFDSSSAVTPLTQPARFWVVSSGESSGSTQTATPPSGYTGYLQATTLAGDNGGMRAAYRIADEPMQLTGSWTNLPSQTSRRSFAFR
jgi:hypothetical protein